MPVVPDPPNRPPDDNPEEREPYTWDAAQIGIIVGGVHSLTEREHRKPSPVKHLHKGPLGFGVNDERLGPAVAE